MVLQDIVSSGRLSDMKQGAGILRNWLDGVYFLPVLENREAFDEQKEKIAAALVDCKMGKLGKRIRLLPTDHSLLHSNKEIVNQWSYLNLITSFWEKFENLTDNLQLNLVYQSGVNFARKKLQDCPRVKGEFIPVFQELSRVERLTQREVWIVNSGSWEWYLLLDFSFNNKPFDKNYTTGALYEGSIIPFPFEGSQRCVDEDLRIQGKAVSLKREHSTLENARREIFSALEKNPFLERFPIVLELRSEIRDGEWYLYDADGKVLSRFVYDSLENMPRVVSSCFYSAKPVCGIWTSAGFYPYAVVKGQGIISLEYFSGEG